MSPYAELGVTTNFSFLRGASHPEELVVQAAALGLDAIGIADRNSLAGVVRAHIKAKEAGIRLVVGSRLVTTDGFEVLAYPLDRTAYGRLCRLLTTGNRRARKGACELGFADIEAASAGQILIVLPPPEVTELFVKRLEALVGLAWKRVYLGAVHRHRGDELRRLGATAELARRSGTPMLALGDVLYHLPERRPLHDVLTCIREKCTVHEAGFRLGANAERHLKPAAEMARLFRHFPDAIVRTMEVVHACRFSLDQLTYEYPDEPVPPGRTPQEHLVELTRAGAASRFPQGVPPRIRATLERELALIRKLDYARYFLTVHDIVAYARGRGILCQGRGSAANSAVCYCLGVTAVDPTKIDLLFERFVSAERNEPPDIDVDFEHERREEVIQHLYEHYGRERAAICATVIHYRPRMAIREVGKALGLTEDITAALANTVWGSWGEGLPDRHIREAGLDPDNPDIRRAVDLASELLGFPRHLSQHVGGFVLTRERLDETVPILNGAMPERTFIEWDKDDIDALQIMKVDVLALGMLSCIRRAFDLVSRHHGRPLKDIADVPQDDAAVYAMLSRADTVGVFQVESRAQMSMLPRLRPKEFYDLVIEVAIVRPGPIQGDMVHPYLQRRGEGAAVTYPSEALRAVLEKTKGVPLFQEQAMQIAIVAAGFRPEEADRLRRAMATFRNVGTIQTFREKFVRGMLANGYDPSFAQNCFNQIEGFGGYGFPESHAASFALLVYVSAWLKCHHPDAFCAAILNAQPMGFYQPAQLVRDAREHGVEVRPPDMLGSDWDCTLEPSSDPASPHHAVRLGLRQVKGLARAEADTLLRLRAAGARTVEDFLHGTAPAETVPGTGTELEVFGASASDPYSVADDVAAPRSTDPSSGHLRPGRGPTDASSRSSVERGSAGERGCVVPFPAEPVASRPAKADPAVAGHDPRPLPIEEAEQDTTQGQTPSDEHPEAVRFDRTRSGRPGTGRPATASDPRIAARDGAAWPGIHAASGTDSELPTRPGIGTAPGSQSQPRTILEADLVVLKTGTGSGDVASSANGARPGADVGPEAEAHKVSREALERLAEADAFRSLGLDRRAALWAVRGLDPGASRSSTRPELGAVRNEPLVELPLMALPEHVVEDYRSTSLSLRAHPCSFFRAALARRGVTPSAGLKEPKLRHGMWVTVAGIVLMRQRPGTAKGTVFVTLEDEGGITNLILWPKVFQANRRIVMRSSFLLVRGRLQRDGEVIHVVADRLADLTGWLARLQLAGHLPRPAMDDADRPDPRLLKSRDFH